MTTEERITDFKKILQDAIDECWDEDVFDESCPPEEYDYEKHGKEEPEDIDPDNTYFEDEDGNIVLREDGSNITVRDEMIRMATEAESQYHGLLVL
jgi:hypothetical protein